jgi:hypothetical protein
VIKKSITYQDFDGNQVTEDHYFHLSKSELLDMEASIDGGMAAKLERVGKSNNGAEILSTFKEILAAAYGERVDGSGSKFFKSKAKSDEFLGSLAFDQLLMDLLTNAEDAGKFISAIMPEGLDDIAAKRMANLPLPAEEDAWVRENREPTDAELRSMTPQQIAAAWKRRNSQV